MNPSLRAAFEKELALAKSLIANHELERGFAHLERAHVLGQAYVAPHARTHWLMLKVELRRRRIVAAIGQVVRIILGVVGSAVGVIPVGNTGGSDVSMFKRMPVAPELQGIIDGGAPLRIVGGTPIKAKHKASCHCGGVVLELDLPDGIVDARRCTCSMCRRKGAVMGAVPLEGLRVVQGNELLSVYRFNTMTAEHFFCSRCGIYTHHRRRSKPNQYGFNVGCLDGVEPTAIEGVPVNDGVNHPADTRQE